MVGVQWKQVSRGKAGRPVGKGGLQTQAEKFQGEWKFAMPLIREKSCETSKWFGVMRVTVSRGEGQVGSGGKYNSKREARADGGGASTTERRGVWKGVRL